MKEISGKLAEILISGVFATLLAFLLVAMIANPTNQIEFASGTSASLGTVGFELPQKSGVLIHLNVVGLAQYHGSNPGIIIDVKLDDQTIATAVADEKPSIEGGQCNWGGVAYSSESMKSYGVIVSTRVSCSIELPEASNARKTSVISVVLNARGTSSTSNGEPPIAASGSYSIDGGLVHDVLALF